MRRWWMSWLLAALVGCTGSIGGGGPGGDDPDDPDNPDDPDIPLDCSELRPGKAPLRRLTVVEYDNTVRDLLGDSSRPAERIVDDERGVTNAEARIVTSLIAEQYMTAAEEVADTTTADLDALLECDRTVEGDAACARGFIEALLPQAFRRPVSATEVDTLMTLHTVLAEEQGYREGIRAVIEAVLQSPDFLYRIEVVPTDGEAVVRLDGYQVATRLSYLFWATMPDPTLYAAAEAGELDTPEGIEREARRLLADERAEPAIQGFFHHYLELDHLNDITKDPAVFPTFNSEIADLMREETEAFVHEVMFSTEGDARWTTLMTAPWSMMNAQLAEYYGVSGPTGDEFERVDLDPAYHAGFLTHGSTLASRARTYESSPIHRGMFIRGQVMCGIVPDVPEGLEVTPPDPDPSLTTRQRLAEHRANPVCGSCHKQIDPLGFAFENFDGAGRFRPDENGLDIDASGFIVESDLGADPFEEVPFDGAVDMAQQLLTSEDTQACFSKRWFEYAYGRAEQTGDACSIQTLTEAFRGSEFDIRELLVALTQTDAFLYRVADQDSLYAEEEGGE